MPPREKPTQRSTTSELPDSLPGRGETLPDDLRRRDSYDSSPDELPRLDEDGNVETNLAPEDHPVNDEPMEDLGPEDYEKLIDEAASGKLERRIDTETIDPRADVVAAPGSAEPLDQAEKPLSVTR